MLDFLVLDCVLFLELKKNQYIILLKQRVYLFNILWSFAKEIFLVKVTV